MHFAKIVNCVNYVNFVNCVKFVNYINFVIFVNCVNFVIQVTMAFFKNFVINSNFPQPWRLKAFSVLFKFIFPRKHRLDSFQNQVQT